MNVDDLVYTEVRISDIMETFAKDFYSPDNPQIKVRMLSYHIDVNKGSVIFKLIKEKQ